MIIAKKQQPHSSKLCQSLAGLILLSSLTVAGCDSETEVDSNKPRSSQSLHRVEVVTAEKKLISLTQAITGTLQAVTKIRLYNEESGRIIKLPYHEGDQVTKGTLLVQLDNALLKTEVAKAIATREQEQVDLDRLKKLLPNKIATEEDVAKARTELNIAIAEEERQLTRLQRTSITAPIDGLITERLYEPGDLLAEYSHILTIIDPNELLLKTGIAERWIPLIDTQQPVELRIDALGDRNFPARIVRIHPTIDAVTHKGTIELLLDPVPAGAMEGQFSRAFIKLHSTDKLVIPAHTIHFDPEGAFVYRVRNNDSGELIAEKVFFDKGQQLGADTEILSGLEAGDKIVSRGYLSLRDGKKVVITNDVESTTSGQIVSPNVARSHPADSKSTGSSAKHSTH